MEEISNKLLNKLSLIYGKDNIIKHYNFSDSVVVESEGNYLIANNSRLINFNFIEVHAMKNGIYIAIDKDDNIYVVDEDNVLNTKLKTYKDCEIIHKTILLRTYSGQYIIRGNKIVKLPEEIYAFVLIDRKTYALIKSRETYSINGYGSRNKEQYINILRDDLKLIKRDIAFNGELRAKTLYSHMVK